LELTVAVSRLNHECAPNLGYYFDKGAWEMRVYAVRDVMSGEELTISYVE
jgi:SET domain-containing protein